MNKTIQLKFRVTNIPITYDSLHNRTQKDHLILSSDPHNQLAHLPHDLNGNALATETHQLTFDALDRPLTLDGVVYSYDSQHRREDLIWEGNNDLGTPQQFRILGHAPQAEIGAAILIFIHGTPNIPLHDLQGNQSAILAFDQGIVEARSYTSFGESAPVALTPWGYRSKRTLGTLVDFGRRLYAPTYGRFLSPDPEGYEDSYNLYAYVGNNPLTHQDPYGLAMSPFDYQLYAQNPPREGFDDLFEAFKNPRFQGWRYDRKLCMKG